ncbi:MAG: NAD-dependent epimerase/dehydratase family protein [Cyclobacteriaceae bacterium]|nr:NAD-dependent epimerase/dehydratase family protein [Cyclobacteriaceae bacterium]
MKILITGVAGFIGFHLAKKLASEGNDVIGLDSINDYYDKNLKFDRLLELGIYQKRIINTELIDSSKYPNFKFIKLDIENKPMLDNLFSSEKFDIIINLAAQAGVRYSIESPDVYMRSNIMGFYNLLEASRNNPVKHFVFASSSSVYGDSNEVPFKESAVVDRPISLYAATKKSGELMAFTYSSLYNIPLTGLRFFTVYGPWGRPDMALSIFTENILNEKPIKVFNNGNLSRDFTYIDDIINGVQLVINKIPDNIKGEAPYRIFNIGNNKPVRLMDFIIAVEESVGKKAKIDFQPMQAGDVHKTWADISTLKHITGYKPKTSIKKGVSAYVKWFIKYSKHKNIHCDK